MLCDCVLNSQFFISLYRETFILQQLILKLGFLSKMFGMKIDIEKFDERINFGLWQIQAKVVMIQSKLHKAYEHFHGMPLVSKVAMKVDVLPLAGFWHTDIGWQLMHAVMLMGDELLGKPTWK